MSRITIVDKNDTVVGAKERERLLASDIYRVSSLWLTNIEGDILIAQRAFTKKKGPGRWGPAASGTVEENESYDENIMKETREELGLSVPIGDLIRGPKIFIARKEEPYFCQWYFHTADMPIEKFVVPADEVTGIRWISKKDLLTESEHAPETFLNSTPQWLSVILEY